MRKLTILLIEDNEIHIQTAQEQLQDHNLIICKSYKEFEHFTNELKYYSRYQKALAKNESERDDHDNYDINMFSNRPDFKAEIDVLLTDCLLPGAEVSALAYQKEKWEGQEIPFGPIAVLWGIKNNIPLVGMLMLNNHHDHPIAAALDVLLWETKDKPIKYQNTNVLISTGNYFSRSENGENYKGINCSGSFVKRWDLLLEQLMSVNEPQ